jgi:hypothetical protein
MRSSAQAEGQAVPVHDWSRVNANLFHHFHQAWTLNLANALNGGLLPKGYAALVEQHAGSIVPDVIALQRWPKGNRPVEPRERASLPPTRRRRDTFFGRRRKFRPTAAIASPSATHSAA